MNTARIVVIDDEEIVRISCSRTLKPEGHDVRLAKNGQEGLSMLAAEPADLVLTDLKMPEIDGIDVLTVVKKEWPSTEVIIMTGYQTVETAVKSIKLGAFDYIEKPFTPDSLLAVVTKALAGKSS